MLQPPPLLLLAHAGSRFATSPTTCATTRYLDELEQKLFARKWDALGTYIGVFSRQEAAFVTLIDDVERGFEQPGAPGVVAPAPLAASPEAARLAGQRDSMQFEAQQVFLSLDELNRGVATKSVDRSERAYVRLALAYDRFLKAADLYVKRYQCYYCTATPGPLYNSPRLSGTRCTTQSPRTRSFTRTCPTRCSCTTSRRRPR